MVSHEYGSYSCAKNAKTKLANPNKRQEEIEKCHRQKAEGDAYHNLLDKHNGNIPEGDYRSIAGSHIKISQNGSRRAASPEEQILSRGYIWYPESPKGEEGKPFVWSFPHYNNVNEYVKVKQVEVGFDYLGVLSYDQGAVFCRAYQLKKLVLKKDVGGSLEYVPTESGTWDPACEWYAVTTAGHFQMVADGQPPVLLESAAPAPALAPDTFSLQDEGLNEPQLPSALDGMDMCLTTGLMSDEEFAALIAQPFTPMEELNDNFSNSASFNGFMADVQETASVFINEPLSDFQEPRPAEVGLAETLQVFAPIEEMNGNFGSSTSLFNEPMAGFQETAPLFSYEQVVNSQQPATVQNEFAEAIAVYNTSNEPIDIFGGTNNFSEAAAFLGGDMFMPEAVSYWS